MKSIFWILTFCFLTTSVWSQLKRDSAGIRVLGVESVNMVKVPVDSSGKRKHNPRKATIYSAILPGLGQAYNKKYWKIPIVYAALGITASVFNFNLKEYKKVQYAYGVLSTKDTANFGNVARELERYIEFNDLQALGNARSYYRQNIDYSVLIFIAFWGLNVIDATVDAHLKGFDISDDLSMKIKPSFIPTGNAPSLGISMVFNIGKTQNAKLVKQFY